MDKEQFKKLLKESGFEEELKHHLQQIIDGIKNDREKISLLEARIASLENRYSAK